LQAGHHSAATLASVPDVPSDPQSRLVDVPPEPAGEEPRIQRRSSKTIGPGDIVEVDKKGRRFHALVVELEQGDSGRFNLTLRPLDSRITYRTATVREVRDVWRKARTAA
jgi:hypothetical protein